MERDAGVRDCHMSDGRRRDASWSPVAEPIGCFDCALDGIEKGVTRHSPGTLYFEIK
jgi:hypothetical protein